YTRNRCAYGAWRATQRCPETGSPPLAQADFSRNNHRPDCCLNEYSHVASIALQRERIRYGDICSGDDSTWRHRAGGKLSAGNARNQGRPNGRARSQHLTMIRDLKFGFRQLFKAPAFTIAAVTVLALGIGVNTAVFTLVNTVFFASPAYAKPHEMVQLFSQDKKDAKKFRGFSYPTYLDIREQNTVFTDVMSFNLALV